ncbi:MAG: hypothetical protein NC240_09625 [Clostridium sp.]|nr:hypothetical protein [Clostridium sp.]
MWAYTVIISIFALYFAGLFFSFIKLLVGWSCGFRLYCFETLWFKFYDEECKKDNERKFKYITNCQMTKGDFIYDSVGGFFLRLIIVMCVIEVLMLFICVKTYRNELVTLQDVVYCFFLMQTAFQLIFIGEHIYTTVNKYANKERKLDYWIKKICYQWLYEDKPLESISMLPHWQLGYKATLKDKMDYEHIRFYQKLLLGDYERMRPIAEFYENYLYSSPTVKQIYNYCDIIFYFSFVEKNVEKAKFYYDKTEFVFKESKLVYINMVNAYYECYILEQMEQAKTKAVETLELCNKAKLGTHKAERKLLGDLLGYIENGMCKEDAE